MQSLTTAIDSLSTSKLQLFLSYVAALIAAIILYHQHGVIDPDSVLYLEAARLFALGQWHEAYSVFNWPFYSLCIAATHKITTFNIHQSAVFLNVVFFAITAFSFFKIIELCGGRNLETLTGALVLFSSSQIVGNTLDILMRDEGFWAFLLTSIMFFIRFSKTRAYSDALYWQLSIIVATLFRIEGIAFLIFLPLSLFTFNHKSNLLISGRTYLKANFLNIGLLSAICIVALLSSHVSMRDFGRLDEIFGANAYQQMISQLVYKSEIMSSKVLGKFLDEYAVQGILLTFAVAIISETINVTGRLTSLLGFFGVIFKECIIEKSIRKILYFSAGIAVLNVAFITVKAFVITQRYIHAFSFVLMIFSAFYLANLFKQLNAQQNLIKKILAIFSIIYLSIGLIKNVLPDHQDQRIQQNAVAWLQQKNVGKAPVFYDESRARYYANEAFLGKFNRYQRVIAKHIEDGSISNFMYLMLTFSRDDVGYQQYITNSITGFSEVKRFCAEDLKICSVIFKKTDN